MADLVAEIAVSEAKFRQQTRKVFDDALRATSEFEREANAKLAKVGDGFAKSEMTKAQQREYDRLKKSLDPLYSASKRYEAQLVQLNRAQQLGAINGKQYEAQLERINTELRGAPATFDEVGRSAGRMGGGLQNIGFQIGDFATQVGAGTSATQALGQQLPQLLGGFGAIGAVAGAAAAIMIPLGSALIRTAFDTETLEERMQGLEKATDAMASAAEAATTPISTLRDRYGGLADEIARANGQAAAFAAAQAGEALRGAAGAAGGLFGDQSVVRTPGLTDADWAAVQAGQMDKLREATGATAEEAVRLQMALRRLETSNGPDAVVRDAENLLRVLSEIAGGDAAAALKFPEITSTILPLMQAAQRQIESTRSEAIRLQETYDANTQALKQLTTDREVAERTLAAATDQTTGRIKAGQEEVAAGAQRIIDAIDLQIAKTKELARESDRAFQSMAQAYQSYGASRMAATASQGDAISTIKEAEGFRAKPYWDVNAYRVGFGSDTVTLSDGSVQKVTQGITVTLEDANRDLVRRVAEFQQGIIGDIGGERWDSFSKEQQAALTSIAYNYGSLPDRIVAAVRGGTVEDIANAIGGLAGDNGGINANRRFEEAAPFGSASVAQGQFAADEAARKEAQSETTRLLREETAERERQAKVVRDYGATLAANLVTTEQQAALDRERAAGLQAIEAAGLEGPAKAAAIAEVNGEYEKQRLILTLIEDAKRRQVPLDAMMAGSTMTYAQAIAALGEAAKAKVVSDQQSAAVLEDVAQRQQAVAAGQEAIANTLWDAVEAGGSFEDVIKRLTVSLLQMAAQAFAVGEGPLAGMFGTANGGGGFSQLVKLLFGGFASGGYTGPGGKYQPAGIVHKGEYVMDAATVQAAGGPMALDDLRRRLRGYADGGYVSGGIVLPRTPDQVIPARASVSAATPVNITISLAGANGNDEVARIAQASVMQGLAQYDRSLPGRVQQIKRDPRAR